MAEFPYIPSVAISEEVFDASLQAVLDPSLVQDPASPLTSVKPEINQDETLLIRTSASLTELHSHMTEEVIHGHVVHVESAIAKLQSLIKPPAQPISIVPPAAAPALGQMKFFLLFDVCRACVALFC